MKIADAALDDLLFGVVLREFGQHILDALAEGGVGRRLVRHHLEHRPQRPIDHVRPSLISVPTSRGTRRQTCAVQLPTGRISGPAIACGPTTPPRAQSVRPAGYAS